MGWKTLACASEGQGSTSIPPGTNLHLAAFQGNLQAVRQQIKAGADLNKKDAYGSTPLILAATFGKTEVAIALIDAGRI